MYKWTARALKGLWPYLKTNWCIFREHITLFCPTDHTLAACAVCTYCTSVQWVCTVQTYRTVLCVLHQLSRVVLFSVSSSIPFNLRFMHPHHISFDKSLADIPLQRAISSFCAHRLKLHPHLFLPRQPMPSISPSPCASISHKLSLSLLFLILISDVSRSSPFSSLPSPSSSTCLLPSSPLNSVSLPNPLA